MNLFKGDTQTFEWDGSKNEINSIKNGIDFDEAKAVFYGNALILRSDRYSEARWLAIGHVESRLIAVAFTYRDSVIRIISAPRARKNEERDYRYEKMGRPPEEQD